MLETRSSKAAQARQQMLSQQLRCSEVLDERILQAMGSLPRGKFVPESLTSVAYADTSIPLEYGQQMLAPTLVGQLLAALSPQSHEQALEVGTGSGYLTACLARLSQHVESVEIHADLAKSAMRRLSALAISNARVLTEDVYARREGRFDVIAVTGSVPVWEPRFERWLKPGGRLFVIVGDDALMEAWRVARLDDSQYDRQRLFETSVAPLINARQAPAFSF